MSSKLWRLTGGLCVMFLVLVLAGCVAPQTESAAAPVAATESADASAADFPVAIEHKFGSVTVEAQPERVLTIGFSEQDPVLALGVTPVAVREWFGEQPYATWPWAQDKLGEGAPEVFNMAFGQLNFEAIAALEPDLIVATHSGITEEEYATLAQIAPTLAQPDDYPDFGVPWQDQTRLIGSALGLEARADEAVAAVEKQIADARAAHPEFEGATIVWATPAEGGQFWVVGPNTPPMRFLSALGFEYPAEVAEVVGDLDSAQISGERLDLLDQDILILRTATDEERAALEENPLVQQLAVIQEQRTIFFSGGADPIYGALSFSTVLSLPYAVESLLPQLVEALTAE